MYKTKNKNLKKKNNICTKRKKQKNTLGRFGLNYEFELIKSLNSSNNTDIVEWVCKNMNFTFRLVEITGKSMHYKVYNIKKINNIRDNIFLITFDNFIGAGSWGKVYDAYVFTKQNYEKDKNNIYKQLIYNKKNNIPGFNKEFKKNNTSKNFYLLLTKQENYIDKLIEKSSKNRYAIKIPRDMELDGISLKDILFEPTIHGSICLNKKIKDYVPYLKTVFVESYTKNITDWKNKCISVLESNNNNKKIPQGKIISVMEKLDGSFDNILNTIINVR